ncbi:hypothetical protein XENTR_v10015134 [Xenopus tropicalis]|nr:hypothetical protein XENTR_v10015134 [Xenopus tropicalis]
MAGSALSKKCPLTKEMFSFPQNIKLSLNFSSTGQENPRSGETHMRSISPWNYSINMDKNRFPSVINEAVCVHNGCLDAEGNVDISLRSAPIQQTILVLRREVRGCSTSFWLEKQTVTVGCTCIRKEILLRPHSMEPNPTGSLYS